MDLKNCKAKKKVNLKGNKRFREKKRRFALTL